MKPLTFPTIPLVAAFSLLLGVVAQAQIWTFGFEEGDFQAIDGSFTFTFDEDFAGGTLNAESTDTMPGVTGGTTNYVISDLDANEGSNFWWGDTADQCIGFGTSSIGLADGQEYQICFWAAAIDEDLNLADPTSAFSASPAIELEDADGATPNVQIFGTDEEGLAVFTAGSYSDPPDAFSDPGWSPVGTTNNDPNNLQWVQYCMNFTHDAAYETLWVSGFGADGGDGIGIDSIVINAVPEPSALLLLLAGSSLFLGRRRA